MVFYRFERISMDSRKHIKAAVKTRIDRYNFHDNENAYFWKGVSVDRALETGL